VVVSKFRNRTERNTFVKLDPGVDLPLIAGPAGLQESKKAFANTSVTTSCASLCASIRVMSLRSAAIQTGEGALVPADAAAPRRRETRARAVAGFVSED